MPRMQSYLKQQSYRFLRKTETIQGRLEIYSNSCTDMSPRHAVAHLRVTLGKIEDLATKIAEEIENLDKIHINRHTKPL